MGTVLIVDDSLYMQKVLSDQLSFLGHTVIGTAQNGKEAYQNYIKLLPDFVFMDLTMREYNGMVGIRLIKTFDTDAIIIMCSSMGQQSLIIEALQAGASDFVVKPFNLDRLKEVTENIKSKVKL